MHTENKNNCESGQTPIAYIVFRRPQHTRETFEPIRAYRPSKLFIIADGPRAPHPEDIDLCREVRDIVSDVDWPCAVKCNFAEHNLGCELRVSSGLDWVFSMVDRAIVLEDDCLASPDFFSFCDVLLERYQDSESVWVVSGNSYQPQFKRGEGSYYFSKYPDIWGWATWRRAWCHYRHDLPFLDDWQNSDHWKKCFPTRFEQRYFHNVFHQALTRSVDTWDYQWTGCAIHGGGLAATPNANLVQNIGFDSEGTHTTDPTHAFRYRITTLGPIVHPSEIAVDIEADEYYMRAVLKGTRQRFVNRLLNRARSIAKDCLPPAVVRFIGRFVNRYSS